MRAFRKLRKEREEGLGEKDTTEKILADYNDVFADIINVLVFKGEQKVTPECFENISTRSVYKGRKNKLHEQERDIVKLWKERDIEFAIYGMEILGYDGATYRSQLQKKRKRPVAVLTIVLYFGTDKMWDKPTHLKDVIYIPEGLGEYVNDYKITVFNIAWLKEEEIAKFKSDFKIVANFFVHKRKNKDYVSDDKTEIKHVDEVLKLLSAMTGDERYEEILAEKEKGEYNTMDTVAEHLVNMGEARLGKLINLLLQNNRIEDVKKASVDKEARKKFYKEFGIID